MLLQNILTLQKIIFTIKSIRQLRLSSLTALLNLAPIVGLAEVIVDIVETGATLQVKTDLRFLEEVCPLSARVVVNRGKHENGKRTQLTKLISDLSKLYGK